MKKLLFLLTIAFGLALNANAQCSFDNSFYVDLTPSGPGMSSSNGCCFGGDLITVNVVAGETYVISTCGGGSWDSQITLYDAAGVTVLGYSDDFCGLQSQITWVATYTGVLNVLLDQFYCNSNSSCMSLTVTWSGPPPPAPVNDDCTGATITPVTNGTPVVLTGTTLGATTGPGDGVFNYYPTVWEAITLSGVCNNLTISFCGTTPPFGDVWINLATDCPANTTIFASNWEQSSCGDGNWTVTYDNLGPGTYYIPVLGDEPGYNTPGPYTMTVLSQDCPPPPTNDDCANAIPVQCGDVISNSTALATPDPSVPFCGSNSSNGVWYSFTGTGQTITLSLCGSSYDTRLALYNGDCGTLSCFMANDDFCGLQSQITFNSVAGAPYTILVNGFGSSYGSYTLTVSASAPVNDNCSGAIAITPGVVSSTTSCSAVDAVPAAGTASAPTAGGVWYSYTPGCSGNVTASLCTGTTYNSQISIFTGPCGSFTPVAGNDDFCGTQSSTTWAGTGGTTYYILVHGNGSSVGAFDLTLTQQDLSAPVPNVASLPTVTSGCAVTLTAPTATDNCAGTVTGTTPITTFSLNGTYNITWTYDDGNGNTATQGQQIVINDVTGPTSVLPGDTTIYADSAMCCATLTFNTSVVVAVDQLGNGFENGYTNNGLYSVADDIDVPAGATWNVTAMTFDAFSVTPLPSNIDIWFYNDGGGYPGTVLAMDNITAANYTATIVGSNFGLNVYHYVFNLTTPVSLPGGGSGTQYWVAIQCNGGGAPGPFWEISTTGAYGNDVIQTFGDLSSANWSGGSLNPGADAVFSLTIMDQVYFTDECNTPLASVTQDAGPANGSCFPVGTTMVTYTGTDQNGNSTTYSFNVTVVDDQDPIADLDSSAAYSFSSTTLPIAIVDGGTVMDSILVSGIPTPLQTGDLASVCIDIQHSADQDLTISLVSPQGTVYELSSNNGGFEDDYTSTCFSMTAGLPFITSSSAPFVGSFIPEGGAGFDIFNGEDPNGYWKLVVDDAGSPNVGALMEFHVNFDFHWEDMLPSAHINCGSVATPTAHDNCGTTINATTTDPTTFTADGTYNVTWTYTDAAGNTTTQTQEVVVDDITPPVPTQASIPPSTGSCSATAESVPTAVDACTGATIAGTTTDALTYNVAGTYTITWTYDDGNGNTTTQTQTIIVTDNVDPVPTQPVLGNAIGTCTITVTPPTASDNCAGTITGTTTDPVTYNIPGTFLITWTYDDGNGNIVTQNQTVVVNPCLGIEDESGQWTALIYPNPSSGIFTLSLSEMPTENTEVKLVDGLGQVLYSGILQNQVQQFDFSHLASATYYLLITNNNGHISKPIIIRQNY